MAQAESAAVPQAEIGNASRSYKGGSGGTQTGPGPIDGWYKGSYGTGAQSAGGGASGYGVEGGAGGDGWYGGNCGLANAREWNGADATGGGGGSGYANNGMGHVHQYNGKSFTNSTTAGGGSTGKRLHRYHLRGRAAPAGDVQRNVCGQCNCTQRHKTDEPDLQRHEALLQKVQAGYKKSNNRKRCGEQKEGGICITDAASVFLSTHRRTRFRENGCT